jgi:hypothetical protein
MHGSINTALADFLSERYGGKIWECVLDRAGLSLSELFGVNFSALFGVCGTLQVGTVSGHPSVKRRYGDAETLSNFAGRGSTDK